MGRRNLPENDCIGGIDNTSYVNHEGMGGNIEKQENYLGNNHTQVDVGYKFAMTGNTWKIIKENFPDLLPRLVTRGAIFARMSSEQKQQLILQLKDAGYIVGMCGDGANDCGALKAANVGISLSEAESSVASPFTSKENNISCVPKVIREGRAALITAFGIFKFMVVYSLLEFLSVFVLYSIDSNLTDIQFLFIDIFLVLPFAVTFGRTEAYTGDIVKDTPLYTLMSIIPLMSIGFQVIVMAALQISSYFIVQLYPWFVPFEYITEGVYTCYENYAVFGVSMGQYLILSIVYSKGAPYRKPLYTNHIFSGLFILMGCVITYIAVYPHEWTQNVFELLIPPTLGFRLVIIGFWIMNFCVSYFVEDFVVGYLTAKKILPKLNKSPRNMHEIAELEMLEDSAWPLMNRDISVTRFS